MNERSDLCPGCGALDCTAVGSKEGYQFLKCALCTLIFVDPMPDSAELNAFYQNYHKTSQYTAKIDSKQRRARKRIKAIMKQAGGDAFIDVGCNAGFAVEAARSLGLNAYGIDIDEASISAARNYFPQATFDAMSIQALAETGRTFDIIYCSEVIEHLPEVNGFVASLYKILNADGVLFITTPDIGHRSVAKNPLIWDAVRPPEHLLHFTKTALKKLLKAHGFNQVKTQFNFKPTLKAVVRK